jgi:hypothetical protein
MSVYFNIKKEWIVSTGAKRIYTAASFLSLALVPVMMWIRSLGEVPESLSGIATIALAACAFGAAAISAAMEFFIFLYDDSSALRMIFWFLVLLVFPIGAPIYFFRVYCRSNALRAVQQSTPPETIKASAS